ncbi:MAG: glycosyltransferase family 39 protein [Lewinellaceae bacterium]|nr:glycosyltransferase family 39 protein [Lewinellaceae bacterium]
MCFHFMMMRRSLLLFIPVLYFFLLLAISWFLDFNGLYGQDAHEYLRQSQVLVQRFLGEMHPTAGPGEAELAGGYPLTGALLQLTGVAPVLAMQLVSWLAAVVSLFLFEALLRLLSPGTHAQSRWVYCLLGLGLAPYFVRAGLTAMSDALGLAVLLAALFFGLRCLEQVRKRDLVGFAVFSALAITTRYALVVLLFLPGLALLLELWRMRRFWGLGIFLLVGLLVFLPLWWLKAGAPASPLEHSLLQDWSVLNLFKKTFSQASGTVSYTVPNLVYLLFPVMHPGFCLVLPGLFLLFKKTDVHLYAKRLLALSLLVFLLFLGGLSHQNMRYLLPAYALVLLLVFPAWDRFFAYGMYFFRRLTYALVGIALVCQLAFGLVVFKPVLARNKMEREMFRALKTALHPGDVLYAFDMDIALKTYLPEVEFRNLFLQRYDTFSAGSYMLFNAPALREQWAGKAPMLNWEYANAHFELLELQELAGGWSLYLIIGPK